MKRFFSFLFFIFLAVCILTEPAACIGYARDALLLWFHKILPTLFPFMVISGVIIRMNLTSCFPSAGVYGTLVGFFCGFPMGALTAYTMYEEKQITQKEAEYLCAFTNNMGPVYFCSYVLPTLGITNKLPYLAVMYGIPLLYGLFLRKTAYHSCAFQKLPSGSRVSLLNAIDASIQQAIASITKLGGYLILLQTLYILPELFVRLLGHFPLAIRLPLPFLQAFLCCLLEITGGIAKMSAYPPLYVLALLPLGGLSFILQAGSILKNAGLSLPVYLLHKLIQTALIFAFYVVIIHAGF